MSEKFTPEFIAEQLTYFQRSHKPKGFIVNGTVSSLDGEGDPYPIAVCIDSKTAMYLSEAGYNYPDALAEIDRLREAQRWIPVGERLPDEDVTVLITGGKAVETGCYAEEKWWQMGNAVIVTHWKPLPEPQQEA